VQRRRKIWRGTVVFIIIVVLSSFVHFVVFVFVFHKDILVFSIKRIYFR
jgi:hypothetical protein